MPQPDSWEDLGRLLLAEELQKTGSEAGSLVSSLGYRIYQHDDVQEEDVREALGELSMAQYRIRQLVAVEGMDVDDMLEAECVDC